MPTRRGRALLIAGAGLYVVARFGSIGELYALALAAVVFPIVAVVFVRLGSHRVRFVRGIGPRRVFAGGSVRVRVEARNDGRIGSPPLYIEDPASPTVGGTVRFAVPRLGAGGLELFEAERRTTLRGRYAIGPLRARLVDPFGLAETTEDVGPEATLVVYPRVELLHEQSPPEARGGTGRSMQHRIAAAGDEFYAVRGWQDGDDLRRIHWRSTARRGELMIRQDEITPFPRATLLLDTRANAHGTTGLGSAFEWGISAAASIVWELARQGFALRLATAEGGPGGPRWGREAADPLLTTLAITGASTQPGLTPAVRRVSQRPSAGGALIAIMPPPTPDLVLPLSRLRSSYEWCGAIMLDTSSFTEAIGRERALADQRLADVERRLARAGWRVTVAGATDPIRSIWQTLLAAGPSRLSSASPRL